MSVRQSDRESICILTLLSVLLSQTLDNQQPLLQFVHHPSDVHIFQRMFYQNPFRSPMKGCKKENIYIAHKRAILDVAIYYSLLESIRDSVDCVMLVNSGRN